jgi:hypothetical protein
MPYFLIVVFTYLIVNVRGVRVNKRVLKYVYLRRKYTFQNLMY